MRFLLRLHIGHKTRMESWIESIRYGSKLPVTHQRAQQYGCNFSTGPYSTTADSLTCASVACVAGKRASSTALSKSQKVWQRPVRYYLTSIGRPRPGHTNTFHSGSAAVWCPAHANYMARGLGQPNQPTDLHTLPRPPLEQRATRAAAANPFAPRVPTGGLFRAS